MSDCLCLEAGTGQGTEFFRHIIQQEKIMGRCGTGVAKGTKPASGKKPSTKKTGKGKGK